ncbi:hypothetical protein [Archaeoglobus neptunius]|uniref:hypothetical protein n=1 Tax=Archaeoglobus neptunius TaxID=2798580 RepID=UPI001926F1C4|nr:hypothetical protein [Archaeoglobus neptunius]
MSVVVSASVKVRNCTPQMLKEAAKILKQRYRVEVTDRNIVVNNITVYARDGEIVATADSDYVTRSELQKTLDIVRDAVVASELVKVANAIGKSVSVRIGSEGIALDIE